MEYVRIVTAFFNEVWAIDEPYGRQICNFILAKASGANLPEYKGREAPHPRIVAASQGGRKSAPRAVGLLPIFGTIVHHAGLITDFSGGTSLETATKRLHEFVDEPQVGTILLEFDSPGGSIAGLEEFADEVAKANIIKPVIGIANTMAASAAYWILSQCEEVIVSPSGEIGSVGVIAFHDDISKLLETKGVRMTMIHAGKYKGEFAPHLPLGDEARSFIQSQVDSYYDKFIKAVANGRGASTSNVCNGFGQGRMVLAREAIRMGMADKIDTLDATLARLTQNGYPRKDGLTAQDRRQWALFQTGSDTATGLTKSDRARAARYRKASDNGLAWEDEEVFRRFQLA